MRARRNGQSIHGSMLRGVVLRTLLGAMGLVLASATPTLAQATNIVSISPAAARPGERVNIRGVGFGAMNVRIAVGGVSAQVVFAIGDTVTFVVPPGVSAGPTTVTATNPGGRLGAIGFRVLLGLTVDQTASARAVIGPDGGVVRTQRAGITYELNVPVAALDADTTITLAPVTSMTTLPFSGGILAAAQFEPSGLQLRRPGTLTITFPQPVNTTGLLGFLIDDHGLNLEVESPAVGPSTITLPIAHFTVGGGASAALADFERQIRPLLAALPADLPPTQAGTLVGLLATWIGEFGFDMCSQTDLCERVFKIASQSLATSEAQVCTLAQALVDRGEPFLAFGQLSAVMRIAVALREVRSFAAQAGLPGFDDSFDLACTGSVLKNIVDKASTQALDNPRAGLLVLLVDVSGQAELLGLSDLTTYTLGKLVKVLHDLVTRADEMCLTDPPAGESLLKMISGTFTNLNVLEAGLNDLVYDSLAGCRIRISPEHPSVSVLLTLQLSATTVGLSSSVMTWSIQSLTFGSTIDAQTGLFTAGQFEGVVVVTATSVADPSLYKRVSVRVERAVQISISPGSAALPPGGTAQFTATVVGTNNSAVNWTASGGSIVAGAGAVATYTAGPLPGTFSVTATSVDDPRQTQTVAVTIGPPVRGTRLVGQLAFAGRRVHAEVSSSIFEWQQGWNEPIGSEVVEEAHLTVSLDLPILEYEGYQYVVGNGRPTGGTIRDTRHLGVDNCLIQNDSFDNGSVDRYAIGGSNDEVAIYIHVSGTDHRSFTWIEPSDCDSRAFPLDLRVTSLSQVLTETVQPFGFQQGIELVLRGTVHRSEGTLLSIDFGRSTESIVGLGGTGTPQTITITTTGQLVAVP